MKDTIILYPALGSGHLMSMVELGKLILTQNPSLSITILILTPPNTKINNNNNNNTFGCEDFPSITFHYIPPISFPNTLPPHILTLELCRLSNHHVHHVLQSISKTSNLKAIVLDFLNYSTTHITSTIDTPTYFYYTSGASTLSVFLQLPTIHKKSNRSLKEDSHMHLRIPGLPAIPVADMPEEVKDRESQSYQVYLEIATSMRDSDGVIINTFDGIEGRAVRALSAGLCLPEGNTPPVFCIGPVVSGSAKTTGRDDENGCLSWLDSQPSRSVVLLSFGSMGRFSRSQLREIAVGLERSGQRFLWVVRSELGGGVDSGDEPSLEELLPEGLLEKTEGKGLVVRNWAPQAAILNHDSVGGFVTHCGWNSVLEAIICGVPMVAWPLYAEQKLNKVILVKEMKVALELNNESNGFVSGTELGERVKELMESERGKEIRERVSKMKVSAKEARGGGGSSLVALKKLAESWKEHSCLNNNLSPNSPFNLHWQ
uniref:Glycosyltransferase n=1 Tax=Glycyrrhiza uralensis TaxID=74613 RepID=A0A515L4A4_GLYUR|nr:UDP-glycosyltransferase UGT88E22 [Glycyrrhiza uralensis]